MALSTDTDMVTLKGRTDVAHIPRQPFWLFIVRFFQLFLALIILALSAWAGGGIGFWYAGFGVAIFAFVWTLLFIKYIQLSTFFLPSAYNKYIHLVLECLTVIFWLAAWAALAAVAAVWSWGDLYGVDYNDVCVGYYCRRALDRRSLGKRYTESQLNSMINATKAAAGLGAIEWLLFIGTLISYGIYLHRNRVATRDAQLGIGPAGAQQQEIKMQPVVNQYPVQQPQPQPQPYQQVPAEQFQQQQTYPPQPYTQQQPYQAQSMA